MIEEVIACEHPKCDIHIVRPGKSQCSYEGAFECGSYNSLQMDKTKIAKIDKNTFNEIKDLESDIRKWKKIADDWRKTAQALATDLGNADIAIDCYEDISSGLYDIVRERMISNTNIQKSFDGLHDYATLICTKAGEAQELRVAAEDASDAENTYYWEGYEAALDFAIDSLPNYNN